ncbi:MAG TPA: TauD/TfdA family dioxygenase [Rhodospirillaceae bacterium]|nr:TauD/TfdA family dioxygenase [Rhodospirillaceae bacterium]|tara:strand:+ start:1182 stop:2030 length:849 start_codon:yes stop_codon:yes gene_type:complete
MTGTIDIRPLSDVVGAIVEGVDLTRPLDDTTADLLRDTFSRNSILCIRGQQLAASDQIRFGDLFGPVDSGFRVRSGYGGQETRNRGVMLVSNIRKNGEQIGSLPDGEMQFHSDGAHRDIPYAATTLYAIKLPSVGGDTLFANLAMAYDALDDDTKNRIDELQVRNLYGYDDTFREETTEETEPNTSAATHNLVKTHPVTGRKSLYLSRLMTRHVVGMDRGESDDLLNILFDHAERTEFVYAHKWLMNDLLIWDNRCLNHARTDFPGSEERLLRRLTITEWHD